MVVDHSETGVKKNTYQNNTEWEMMKVTVERKEVSIGPRALPYKLQLLQWLTDFGTKRKTTGLIPATTTPRNTGWH